MAKSPRTKAERNSTKRTAIDKNALQVGAQMAKQTLIRRQQAVATREKALAKITTTTNLQKFGVAKGISAGVLIAEGDSWFDYPFNDVLSKLEDRHGYDVESVAHKGDTVEDMAYGGGQLDDFARLIEKMLRRNVRPRAILLSGGGNDVAGDEFAILLNHATSSIRGINESILRGVVDERLRDAYVTILSAITAVCTSTLGAPVPIIMHGYDYPVPDGRGFAGGWGPLPGPWLEPGFERKGYIDMDAREPLITQLMDRFNEMLKGLAGRAPFEHVHYLDLRKTLRRDDSYKKDWANELHPTEDGFKDVAKKFADAITKLSGALPKSVEKKARATAKVKGSGK